MLRKGGDLVQVRRRLLCLLCHEIAIDAIWHGIYYPQPGEVSDDDICRLLEQETPAVAPAGV
jgi:hypothetical protein